MTAHEPKVMTRELTLPSIMVDVRGADGLIRIRVGIDSCASVKTVNTDLIRRLKLATKCSDSPIVAYSLEADLPTVLTGEYVELELQHATKPQETITVKAYRTNKVLPYLTYVQPVAMRQELNQQNINIIDPTGLVELFVCAQDFLAQIIGEDTPNYGLRNGGVIAIPTKLGYFLKAMSMDNESDTATQRTAMTPETNYTGTDTENKEDEESEVFTLNILEEEAIAFTSEASEDDEIK